MTSDDIRIRHEKVMASVLNDQEPTEEHPEGKHMCLTLQEDFDLTNHETVHAFIGALAVQFQMRGVKDAESLVMVTFQYGRKWGLMEAADAFQDISDDTL
jgi:hypothetical protein